MKKISMILSATLAVFALASCKQDININPADGETVVGSIPFELAASADEFATRTALDATTWNVSWESDRGDKEHTADSIYVVTTDKAWGADGDVPTAAAFAFNGSTFSTESTIAPGEHTFYFLYSNNSQKKYHRTSGTSHQLYGTQTMDAAAPTDSIRAYDALVGVKTFTTPQESIVKVTMNHLYTLMKVTLKNKTGADITATKFEFTADSETHLYGIYDVSFGSTPSIKYNSRGGNSICVNILNGTIANDGTLDVYFVMAPLTNYSKKLTMKVTDGNGNSYVKTNDMADLTLAAGTYNTASFTCKTPVVDYVTLDWEYAGGTSAELNSVVGVTTSGLGSDYAEGQKPYRVKFDTAGDFIQVKTDAAIQTVSVGYKMIGGANTSYLNIYESTNGTTWGDRIDRLTISGTQNSTGTLSTTATFSADSRFVKIEFEKGSNVGIGPLSITKKNNDPAIVASDIYDVPAIGCTSESSEYTVVNFTDDVEVGSVTGCVSEAIASNGTILYSVSPNYESTAASGTIVLQSAGNGAVTKTITVHQLSSSLSVSATEVFIPNNDDEITFTITSPEFGWLISADDDSHIQYDKNGTASSTATTVTVTSDVAATDVEQTIATLTVIRNSNTDDPQAKQVVVKKAKSGSVTWTRVTDVATLLAGGTFIIGYEAEANSGVIIPMANTGSATTTSDGFMYSGANASSGNNATIDMSSLASSTKYEVAIVASTSVPGAICIKIGDNYLGNNNSKNNCRLFAEEAATTAFTPTAGDNDVFTLIINANEKYNKLQYNSASPRFAVYGGTQKDVVIYKKDGATPEPPKPTAIVVTGGASDIAIDEATLSGSYSGATGTITETGFEYGTSSSLGSSVSTGTTDASFSAVVNGLASGTAYFYRAYAKVSVGDNTSICYGNIETFSTTSGGEAGTLENPLTASQAKEKALSGDTGTYYIRGTITKVQNQFSAGYGTANFWIDENGTAEDVFEGYKIKYFGNVNWVEGNATVAVGDEVIINGALKVYNETTAETSSGYLVSLNGKTKALTVCSLTATPDNANKQITVTWGASSGTDSAISYAVTCGDQVFNATAAGSHTFTMNDYGTYNVTVVASAADALSATAATPVKLTDPSAGTNYYVKVSSITAGKRYLIVGGGTSKVLVPSTGTGRKESADVTISSDKIESTATVDANAVTIIANGSNYDITFTSGDTTYYLQWDSSTNLATATSSSETKTWNVVDGTYGTFRFNDVSTLEASTKRGLVFRAGTTNKFGGYSLSNVNGTEYYDIDLYEYVEGNN